MILERKRRSVYWLHFWQVSVIMSVNGCIICSLHIQVNCPFGCVMPLNGGSQILVLMCLIPSSSSSKGGNLCSSLDHSCNEFLMGCFGFMCARSRVFMSLVLLQQVVLTFFWGDVYLFNSSGRIVQILVSDFDFSDTNIKLE